MLITLVGIDHKGAPVSMRERFAFGPEEVPAALKSLGEGFDVGAALLSTCNRTEVYLTGADDIEAAPVVDRLRALKGHTVTPTKAFYHRTGQEAARHLFRVAAGIESMVVGEAEVLGQVRGAFAASASAATSDVLLSKLFHHAIRAGRKARSETDIGRNAASVSSTAVALARQTRGGLTRCTVLVAGAGGAGKLTARNMAAAGVARLLVTSRTADRSRELAEDLGGEPVAFRQLTVAIGEADIVVSSSGAPHFLIGPTQVAKAMAGRDGRPLLLIDIAVPRDVDPAVREIDSVRLYDIDDLQAEAEKGLKARHGEIAKVEEIIEGELDRFAGWVRTQGVVPTVAALQERADAVWQEEMARTMKRLRGLTPEQRESVEAMANDLARKLLHDPIARLKAADGEQLAPQVREIFALDGKVPEEDPDSEPEA